MSRPLRTDFDGALHHVTSRGNERRPIFIEDQDRTMFLTYLGEAVARFGWSLTAYVLMTNHFHLVVQTPSASLSRGMHWLNTKYVGWFNRRHDRCGHLFQGRFKSYLIEKETYFQEVLRYVVLNPVRAGLVDRPEQYAWSSYRATAGLDEAQDWLDVDAALASFGTDVQIAQVLYRDLVLQRLESRDDLWQQLVHGIFLGNENWIKRMRKAVESQPRSSDHPKTQRGVGRPTIQATMAAVARTAGCTTAAIRSARGGQLRQIVAWVGWHEGWATLRSIAASLRLRSEGYVSTLIRRAERMFSSDGDALAILDGALATLRA